MAARRRISHLPKPVPSTLVLNHSLQTADSTEPVTRGSDPDSSYWKRLVMHTSQPTRCNNRSALLPFHFGFLHHCLLCLFYRADELSATKSHPGNGYGDAASHPSYMSGSKEILLSVPLSEYSSCCSLFSAFCSCWHAYHGS